MSSMGGTFSYWWGSGDIVYMKFLEIVRFNMHPKLMNWLIIMIFWKGDNLPM
jgi:hypothetical protein